MLVSYSFNHPINSYIFGKENESRIMREVDINRKKRTVGKKDLSLTFYGTGKCFPFLTA